MISQVTSRVLTAHSAAGTLGVDLSDVAYGATVPVEALGAARRMDDELREITEPSAYLPHVKAGEPPAGAHAHDGAIETVREAVHRGHRIVVRTSYEIEVDGRSAGTWAWRTMGGFITTRCPTSASPRRWTWSRP